MLPYMAYMDPMGIGLVNHQPQLYRRNSTMKKPSVIGESPPGGWNPGIPVNLASKSHRI